MNQTKKHLDLLDAQQNNMKEFGFYIHYVPNDPELPCGVNVHTHGLTESFGHPDIQVVLNLPPKTVGPIIHIIVDRIRNGEKFGHDGVYSDIIKNYLVRFVNATEGKRKVLRLIFPDSTGESLERNMQPSIFRDQYKDLLAE